MLGIVVENDAIQRWLVAEVAGSGGDLQGIQVC